MLTSKSIIIFLTENIPDYKLRFRETGYSTPYYRDTEWVNHYAGQREEDKTDDQRDY